MFLFCFGIFLTLMFVPVIGEMINNIITGENLGLTLSVIVVPMIGIIMMFIGLKQIIRNMKTNIYGITCFGKILDIYSTGVKINGRTVYNASVLIYIENEGITKIINEKIDYKNRFFKGYYVTVKYYNNDINFVDFLEDERNIPQQVITMLDKGCSNINKTENEYKKEENNKSSNYSFNNIETKYQNINGKFEIQFGAIWTIIMLLFSFLFLIADTEENPFGAIIILGLFWLIGITMIYNGIKKRIADSNTEKFGIDAYGKICKIESIGSSNGNSYYKACVAVYVPSENITKIIDEDIGYYSNKFSEVSYLRLKYYEGDINIKEEIDGKYIPENIKSIIDELVKNSEEQEILEEIELASYYEEVNNSNYKKNNISNQDLNSNDSIDLETKIKRITGILKIIFGFFWTAFVFIVAYSLYNTTGYIFVNGQQVTHEEFYSMLFPKIFLGIFFVIGISTIISGTISCFKSNTSNSIKKEENNREHKFNDYKKIDNDVDNYDPIQRR